MREYPAFIRDVPATRPPVPLARPVARGERPDAARPQSVPGEPGLWVLLLGDMTVFTLFFGAFLLGRAEHPGRFAASREHLTVALGALNTIVLLTSSLCVALAVRAHRDLRPRTAARLIDGAEFSALVFVALKAVEWGGLLHDDLTPSTGAFFMFYFVITGVHLLHVIIGTGGLLVMRRTVLRPAGEGHARLIVESAASYWHMVDLLWIVIFPLLYFAAT